MGAQLQACGRICGREEAAAEAKERVGNADSQGSAGAVDWGGRVKGTPIQDEGFICMGGPAPLCPTGPMMQKGGDWDNRVKATPIQDEGFICMGGPAPLCPTGPMMSQSLQDGPNSPICPAPTLGPVTLEVLQGAWIGSSGSQITVLGTAVFINGMPLNGQSVELDDNGLLVSIGRLWQFDKWSKDGGLEFRASSTRENMECARSEVWTKAENATDDWTTKMKLMGYGGSSKDPLGRGVEGCMPGTMGIEEPEGYAESKDKRDVGMLQALVSQWREESTDKIICRNVVPDFTNRAQTGLGVELVHFVAISIAQHGFKKRVGTAGHDIPIVVREESESPYRDEAISIWTKRVGEEEGFPQVRVAPSDELFTSLGNGHFFQALNLFDCQCRGINDERVYRVGTDVALKEAITKGVPSIVLKHQTPKPVRSKIAELLNKKREFHWTLSDNGQVDVDVAPTEDKNYCSQFEWLSKGMDAEQVNCLVRTHLKIKDSKRIMG